MSCLCGDTYCPSCGPVTSDEISTIANLVKICSEFGITDAEDLKTKLKWVADNKTL